jgi:hypothetical protein
MDLVVEAVYGLRDFRDAQAKAYQGADGAWDKIHDRPSMVFVAPEYMFAKRGRPGVDDRLCTLDEKNAIEKQLKTFSAELGTGVILAPGSISYVEPLLWNPAKKAEIEQRLKMGTSATKRAIDAAIVRADQVVVSARVAAAVPYAGLIAAMELTNAQAKAANLRALKPQQTALAHKTPSAKKKQDSLDGGGVKFVAKNEMVLYHKGRDVARYAKVGDYQEVPESRQVAGPNCTIFIPGLKAGRATVGGVPWGVEICFDHNLGVLNAAKTEALPLVHLLCSAAVNRDENHTVVKAGGYVIHSSSDDRQCGVWQKDLKDNKYAALAPIQKESVLGGIGEMREYVIDLNLP